MHAPFMPYMSADLLLSECLMPSPLPHCFQRCIGQQTCLSILWRQRQVGAAQDDTDAAQINLLTWGQRRESYHWQSWLRLPQQGIW